ncbi:tetratricopeptide repeat protein [Reichenbachiella sp. MALMAid0571]|uniref:tetratricopeptide repeat protein n=1 Tax=Reichenbachiella sp. MALMAid0571 TaxID=3143939 RepID=UPI0032DF7CB6
MRKSNFAIALVTGLFLLSGCSALKNMQKLAKDQDLQVTPNPLEVHGDKVKFEMSAVLPAKMLPSKYMYTINTFYKYGESDKTVGSIELKSSDFPNQSTSTSRKSGEFEFDYVDAMKSGNLEIQGVASSMTSGKSLKTTDRLVVAPGIITTSKLVKDVYYTAYAFHGYNDKEELVPTTVDFFFDQGRSLLKSSETRSKKGKDFSAFIADKNVTRTVTIIGGHSPEGTETINSDLSGDRAAAIEKYYRAQMKKYDYKEMADGIKFVLKPVIQDWKSFKDALNSYNGISDAQKSEIIKIVNGAGTFEDKEKALQKLDSYKAIFKDIYPGLRIAKTEVLTVKIKKSNPTISVLAKQIVDGKVSADTLSNEELLFAASLTPSLSEKEAIYKAATKKSGSWQSHNNLGAVYLDMAMEGNKNQNIEKAVAQFEIAAKKNNAAEVLGNLATSYLMQGDNVKAFDTISEALGKSPSKDHAAGMNGVKGALEIKRGEYDAALSSLGSAKSEADVIFDRGLALLLNKDFQNAITAFGDVTEKDSDYALAYYCSAIASARLKNDSDMISSLKKAVDKDPKLKDMALNDLEFNKYAGAVSTALK